MDLDAIRRAMFKISLFDFDENKTIKNYLDNGFVSWEPRYRDDLFFLAPSDIEASKHAFVQRPLLLGYAENIWLDREGPIPNFFFKKQLEYANKRSRFLKDHPDEYHRMQKNINIETEMLRVSEYKFCRIAQSCILDPIALCKKVMEDVVADLGFSFSKALSTKSNQVFIKQISKGTWISLSANAIWPKKDSIYRSTIIIQCFIVGDVRTNFLKNEKVFPFHFDALNPVSFYYRAFGNNSELEISIRAKLHYYKMFMEVFEKSFYEAFHES